ncbi:MAG: nicotinate-nucleotide--dimethylbenzimidazole phosphoribosyltransferase [Lachnospiraceae bacterium]|nr:nicotinate-nucleotide--dimethylbenzimidazole phosphoribosyltransferase [Lachnospiraceae bacterium]
MTYEELKKIGKKMIGPERAVYDEVIRKWDHIAKPIDGLGKFEKIIARIGAIQHNKKVKTENRTLIVFLSDNGIVDEGVSQCGQEVTVSVAKAMSEGRSTVCVMADKANVKVHAVDVGMAGERINGIKDLRIRNGSRNFAKEPAMSMQETLDAIKAGYDTALNVIKAGADIILLGEMGIGNTSTSTALSCAILNTDPLTLTGHGAGLGSERAEHKRRVISDALAACDHDRNDIPGLLSIFGGYDIAAMTGAILASATECTPVVADGLITLTAVLVAERMFPGIKDICIASHEPREPMGRLIMRELDMEAPIDADMALGEGTGAVLLMPLIDVCKNLYDNGIEFDGLGVKAYKRYDQET